MGLIGTIWSGINSGNAAKAAGNSQMVGAQNAQSEIAKGEQQSRDFLNGTWSDTQANQQPYLDAGTTAANRFNEFLKTPFQAPTLAEAEQTPGYQFTLEQGTNAINQNAAANGTLLSGNTGAALERYGQGLASTTYGQDYQRALDTYMANYQTLMGGSQLGENAASTLGQQGNQASGLMTNIDLGGSEAQAQQINNAAAARASGYVGKANALNTTVQNANQQLMEAALMAGG